MMDSTGVSVVDVAVRLLAGLAVGAALLWIYRWIRDQSPLLGAIVAAGLLLRTSFGLLLFWVSYLDLPIWRGLHSGDGFWEMAPDAIRYVGWASAAASAGLDSLHSGSASPTYVKLLAMWMQLVGIGPAAGMFLNLLLYGVLCGLVTLIWRPRGTWREDLPAVVLIGSVTLSPVLLIHGTQPLKDDAFVFLVAVACTGVFLLLMPAIYGRQSAGSWRGAVLGLGLLWLAVFTMGGIRAYYAFLVWGILTAVFVVFSVRWNVERLRRGLPVGVAVSVLLWSAYTTGAGAYAYETVNLMSRVMNWSAAGDRDTPVVMFARETWTWVERARGGFIATGGATNIVARGDVPPDLAVAMAESSDGTVEGTAGGESEGGVPDAAAGFGMVEASTGEILEEPVEAGGVAEAPGRAAGAWRVRRHIAGELAWARDREVSRVRRLSVGLATLFVPISLLQALSVVDFVGGRNLLFITDVDTLFVNVTLLASVVLLYRRRDAVRQHLPYVCFALVLAGVTAVLLAYVVTNFGTMFRLRLLVAVPIWMLALAASPRWDTRAQGARRHP